MCSFLRPPSPNLYDTTAVFTGNKQRRIVSHSGNGNISAKLGALFVGDATAICWCLSNTFPPLESNKISISVLSLVMTTLLPLFECHDDGKQLEFGSRGRNFLRNFAH
jgi:hypothetical protein